MYDFKNNEELRSFFNVNPELEPSQRFTLHNREEVVSFETMLNKHVETETHLSFHSLNLIRAFDYCMSLSENGRKLFAAILDLKITIAFLFIDAIKFAPDFNALNHRDGTNILEDESLFNKKMKMLHHNIDLAVRYRAFYDKFMGLNIMLLNPSKYEDYNNTIRGRKNKFQSLVKGLLDDKSISSLIEQVTYLDNNYRTPEVHKTGSMRTWVLTSQDLFLDKQLNLMNYFNWVLGYADWVDTVIADNKEKSLRFIEQNNKV
ncbi:MAG: hypothetical protein Q4E41_04285 [Bacteroidales bacterium]|nr:hypothetical protein [Bacteroidales bacterium]